MAPTDHSLWGWQKHYRKQEQPFHCVRIVMYEHGLCIVWRKCESMRGSSVWARSNFLRINLHTECNGRQGLALLNKTLLMPDPTDTSFWRGDSWKIAYLQSSPGKLGAEIALDSGCCSVICLVGCMSRFCSDLITANFKPNSQNESWYIIYRP